MTPKQFGVKLSRIMTPQVMMGDMLSQDELFAMQEEIADLICDAANGGNAYTNAIANAFINEHPRLFKQT